MFTTGLVLASFYELLELLDVLKVARPPRGADALARRGSPPNPGRPRGLLHMLGFEPTPAVLGRGVEYSYLTVVRPLSIRIVKLHACPHVF